MTAPSADSIYQEADTLIGKLGERPAAAAAKCIPTPADCLHAQATPSPSCLDLPRQPATRMLPLASSTTWASWCVQQLQL